MGKFDVRSQERKADGTLSNWVTDDRGVDIHRMVNLATVESVVVHFDDGSRRTFKSLEWWSKNDHNSSNPS